MVMAQHSAISLHYGHSYLHTRKLSPDAVNDKPSIRLVLLRNGQKHVQPTPRSHRELAEKPFTKHSASAPHLPCGQCPTTSQKSAANISFQHGLGAKASICISRFKTSCVAEAQYGLNQKLAENINRELVEHSMKLPLPLEIIFY
jgi:hypothetical protein